MLGELAKMGRLEYIHFFQNNDFQMKSTLDPSAF